MPRIRHQQGICAHARQGHIACTRCVDICPAGAIDAAGEGIRVDSELCTGCALCAVVCPTGAMAAADLLSQHLLAGVQRRIADARKDGGAAPVAVFYGADPDSAFRIDGAGALNRPLLAFALEEIGHAGPEVWLGAVAYGAHSVVVSLPSAGLPATWKQAFAGVHAWAAAALLEIGLGAERISLALGDFDWRTLAGLGPQPGLPATFPPYQTKRDLIRCSIMHLAAIGSNPRAAVRMPDGAPFGAVTASADCTLCTACAGICPTSALSVAGATAELRFEEAACIQCGQCRSVCPEQALELFPRMTAAFSPGSAGRLLHAEEPFACIGCGQPFASTGMVRKLTARLAQHWMYRGDEEKRLLKLCRDCRVREMFQPSAAKREP